MPSSEWLDRDAREHVDADFAEAQAMKSIAIIVGIILLILLVYTFFS